MRTIGLLMTFIFPLALPAAEENWPEFRGPGGQGHSSATGLPLTWSRTENVRWKTAIHDRGWSSPVVWEDRIWVTTATENGKRMFAVGVDRKTGEIVRDIPVLEVAKPEQIATVNSYASPTPAIEAGRIYVHYGTYGTACLDTRSGEIVWTRRDLNCDHHEGPGSSPILFEDLLIVDVDGRDVQYVVALDKATGKTRWKTNRSIDFGPFPANTRKAFCTPLVVRFEGALQLVSPGAKGVMGYDPGTGEELWKVRYNGWSMVPRPVSGGDLVYLVNDYERPELWAVRLGGRGDVTDRNVAWKIAKGMPGQPSFLLIDGLLYAVNDIGVLHCIEARTGEIVWKERLEGSYAASPIYADGRMYFFSDEGRTTVVRPGREFKALAANELGEPVKASPAVAGNALIVRTKGNLYCIEADPLPTDPDEGLLKAKGGVVEAWKDMRFGMFICWGPVTLTGLEIGWSRGPARPDQKQGGGGPTPVEVYDNLYKRWSPERFDARAWIGVAKDAGARYIIFLVKHHDGFCLYDTKLTDYRSTGPESAWKVDVLKAVADACHEAGIELIVYYSQPDWHHPDYRTENHARYIRYLHGQIREILTNYGRIDGLWFDLGGTPQDWDSEDLFKMARRLQPDLIINNRCGLPGDFDTPEQYVGGSQFQRPWETCMTLGTQWSWKPDDAIKSFKECIDTLVTCAVRDGNLALNTNPMPDGQIEPRQAERFREIGRWLAKYGESIYGTRGGPFRSAKWGGTTRRGDIVYVHVLAWPPKGLTLPPIPKRIVAGSCLTGGTVSVEQTEKGIDIGVPPGDRRELDTIVALKLDGPAGDIAPIQVPSGSLTAHRKIAASSAWGPGYEPEKAVDDDEATRWGAAPGSRTGWLEVDFGAETSFNRAAIDEGVWNRIEEFDLQSWDGASWRTIAHGSRAGRLELTFPTVTARRVRLDITKASDVPTIWEFQLFKD